MEAFSPQPKGQGGCSEQQLLAWTVLQWSLFPTQFHEHSGEDVAKKQQKLSLGAVGRGNCFQCRSVERLGPFQGGMARWVTESVLRSVFDEEEKKLNEPGPFELSGPSLRSKLLPPHTLKSVTHECLHLQRLDCDAVA